MSQSFGARLRQRREEQHIALSAIAEQTKIKLSLLEALERDDVSHWPSGIFRRAYIRAYGHAIGLSPDAVVREFLEAFPEPGEDITSALATAAADTDRGRGARTRLRHLVSSAIGSLSRSARVHPADGRQEARPMSGSPAVDTELRASLETWRERGLVEGTTGVVYREPSDDPAVFGSAFDLESSASEASEGQPVEEESAIAAESPRGHVPDAPQNATLETAAGVQPPASPVSDFLALADLCTQLGRVEGADELESVLGEAGRILDASGLIVWLWDPSASALRPALVHGYSDQVVAQLPPVEHDADNATAAAFRLAQPCRIASGHGTSGALVVPLLTPRGCAGVLALELQDGREQAESFRAAATIIAALLSQLVGGAEPAEVMEEEDQAMRPAVGDLPTTVLRVNVRPDGHARVPIR